MRSPPSSGGTESANSGRFRGSFHVLLVGADGGQRRAVDDVRHRVVPAPLTEVPGRLPPALRPHTVLLAQQGQEDLGLVCAEAGPAARHRSWRPPTPPPGRRRTGPRSPGTAAAPARPWPADSGAAQAGR